MRMSWCAIFEQYIYTTLEEKMEHRKEMLQNGYSDCGVVSETEPDSDGTYKRFPAGKYKKYIFKEQLR